MYGPMGVFEVIKSWRVTERCSFFNQRLFLELFADETIAKIPSHGTNGEINPTWIGWFSVGFHVSICKHGSYGMVTVIWAPKPWLVGLPLGILLYTNREYHHKPIYKDPPFFGGGGTGQFPMVNKNHHGFCGALPRRNKGIVVETKLDRVVGQDKAAYDFLELHALGYDAWRLRLMILDGKMLSQPDFLVGKNTQIYTPIYN